MSLNAFSFQAVQPKAGTPGPATEGAPSAPPAGAGPQGSVFGGLGAMLPLLLFLPLFFVMMRRQKKEQAARSSLKKGDRVLTNAGIVGELMEMDEKYAKVKIAPGTTVQVVSTALSPLEPAASAPAATAQASAKLAEKK